MALYLPTTHSAKIETSLDYWTAEAAIIDMAADGRLVNSRLKHMYLIFVRRPKFIGRVINRSSYLIPTNEESTEGRGPEFSGTIEELGDRSIIEIKIGGGLVLGIFAWLIHLAALVTLSFGVWQLFKSQTSENFWLVAISAVVTLLPVLYTNLGYQDQLEEIVTDIKTQIRERETRLAKLTKFST